MISRRAFLGTVAGAVLAAPLAAGAQQTGKVYRIGWLAIAPPNPGNSSVWDAFIAGLREGGWVEGQNLIIEGRYSEGRSERFPDLAAELVRLNVDVIVPAAGPTTLNAARNATKTIPIVMVASSSDPVRDGFAASIARPGGHITGIASLPEELLGKRLELLKEAVPGLSRVGVLRGADIDPRTPRQLEVAAGALGLELRRFEARDPKDLNAAVGAATKERVGALLVPGSPLFVQHRGRIADLLTRHRLPAISLWRSMAEAGLLMTYGPSLSDEFRRAAAYVDKILKGAKPADLPIEQPTKIELVINLKTAKALGLTIPPSILARADQVIE
jgi:putative ABC transport system substrate-binding protein